MKQTEHDNRLVFNVLLCRLVSGWLLFRCCNFVCQVLDGQILLYVKDKLCMRSQADPALTTVLHSQCFDIGLLRL